MASNTQIILECLALLIVIVGLYKSFKTLFLKEVNGYIIKKESSLFTVYKGSTAMAQFIYERSAEEYCKNN